MNVLYIILALIVLFWVLFKYYKKRKNELYTLELQSIYDKIEIAFITNEGNKMSNDEIEFLKSYKRIVENSYFLDIRCLIIAHKEQKKYRNRERLKEINNIVERQSDEFKKLLEQFHHVSYEKVRFSFYNSGFLWICAVVLFQSFSTCSISFLPKKESLKSVMDVLSPSGMRYVTPQTC